MKFGVSVGIFAMSAAFSVNSQPAMATSVQVTDSNEEVRVLCEWIGRRTLPAGVHTPSSCPSAQEVSQQEAIGEIVHFWNEWNATDEAGVKAATDSFFAEWGNHWDPDYKCRAAENMCRDGLRLCPEYRDDLIQAGRWCPGVTDQPIPVSAQQAYDSESARQQALAICQNAMRQRPMGPPPGVPSWSAAAPIASLNARLAAVNLCLSDSEAHLKPLPWEQSVQQPGPSTATMCFYQAMPGGQATLMCP